MSDQDRSADQVDVLLVEDNPGDVRLIQEMLDEGRDRSTGIAEGTAEIRKLSHADRLKDGLQQLRDTDVDVVLLDLGLPDSTGLATLESVLEQSHDTAIVVLTGIDDEMVGDNAVQQGAQEYLAKDELTPTLLRRSLRHAIERKKFERTQTALHRASRDLIQAESKAEVSEFAVDTAVEVLGLPGIAISLFDDSANVLEPIAYTEYIEDIFGELPSFGPDDTAITWQAFITDETITFDDVLESEHVHREDTPLRSGIWVPLGDHGVLTIVSEEVGGFDQQTVQLADHLATTAEAALDRVEREESLRDHERELADQNRQLEDLNRMNVLIRQIDQALVQATTRDAIEQAVCERLVEDDRFTFAWIGSPVDEETLSVRTWAGANQGYLDAISLSSDDNDAPPSVTTMATGSVTLVSNVATNLRGAPWRKAALARDLQAAISTPLTYNDLTYGVLTVFSSEPDAFGPRSRDIAAELGETIGNAMNSVETRQALLADTVVELELAIRESGDPLYRLAREADCNIEYGGIVPQSDGTNRVFFRVSGASATTIDAVTENIPSIQGVDHISESGTDDSTDEGRFEVTVSGPTIPSVIVECGAVAKSLHVTSSEISVVVELPDNTDVRTFVNRFEKTFPDTELVARRDKERTDQSQQAFEAVLTGELTDRQLETLQTAYYSGYFQWPRERTGEEVAESLGITQPTFNGHLRAAERKLCAMLFDGTSEPG